MSGFWSAQFLNSNGLWLLAFVFIANEWHEMAIKTAIDFIIIEKKNESKKTNEKSNETGNIRWNYNEFEIEREEERVRELLYV